VIDLYTAPTPNGWKASIMLEETKLKYDAKLVRLDQMEQKQDWFLKISPNNKIPAIVDQDNGVTMMQSGAILLYLADKTGQLMPKEGRASWQVVEWLMWQMGDLGPMIGQAHHFLKFNKGKSAYAEERYGKEVKRLYGVLDKRLAEHEYIVDAYSVADIAAWPWISRFEWHGIDIDAFPNVKRWYLAIASRPAVQKGYHVPKKVNEIPIP